MKILFINTLYCPNFVGGAELSVQSLAESIVEKGHNAIVFTTAIKNIYSVKIINGVKVYYSNLRNIYWPFISAKKPMIRRLIWHFIDIHNPFMASELRKILNIEMPDIIHTNNLSGISVSAFSVARQYNLPIIHTIRDFYLICHKSNMFRNNKNCFVQCFSCKLFSFYKKNSSKKVNSVVGISKFILDRHTDLGYFNSVKIKNIIPNSFKIKSPSKTKVPQDKIKIGYLGRLEKMKGIEFLLKNLESFNNKSYELHVGGTGYDNYMFNIKNKFNCNVYYHGYVDPTYFLQKIDILIVPSLWNECFGRTIIEAYAHGVPVIGSNRGGIPEIIDVGKTGYIFDPDCDGSFNNIFSIILNDPTSLSNMRLNCIEKAKEFLPKNISEQYLNLYFDLL